MRTGDAIGINYDPMIAKLIAHGDSREAALSKLSRALSQYQILGLSTNISFLAKVVDQPEFRAADFDTGFIGKHEQLLFARDTARLMQARVLAAAAMLPAFDTTAATAWSRHDMWRMNLPAAQRIELEHDGAAFEVSAVRAGGGWHFAVDGQSWQVTGDWLEPNLMRVGLDERGIEFPVLRTADGISLIHDGETFDFAIPDPIHAGVGNAAGADHPQAPMSGAVVALPVSVGDTVEPGDTLIVIEAMKMEHAVVAQVAGRVGEILFAVGDQVDEGETLVLLEVE